jgi:hypothetical protein
MFEIYKQNRDLVDHFREWVQGKKSSFSEYHPSLPHPCYYSSAEEYSGGFGAGGDANNQQPPDV